MVYEQNTFFSMNAAYHISTNAAYHISMNAAYHISMNAGYHILKVPIKICVWNINGLQRKYYKNDKEF